MVPLARSHRERIEHLRRLVLDGEARNASRVAAAEEVEVEKVRGERLLDL
jgi:hypothetical protein